MFNNETDAYKFILGNARRSKKENRTAVKKKVNSLRVNAPEVMLKIKSFTKSKNQVAEHLSYITRNGKVLIFDPYDRDVSEERAAGDIARDLAEIKGRKTMNIDFIYAPWNTAKCLCRCNTRVLKK